MLYLINLLSQLSLLFFSGWFIAACALSGQAGVLAGFNYMVPATVIRFFALTRISSGYFEKYLSHLLLLRLLKQLRAKLLTAVFYKQKNLTQSETGQALQQQTEQIAASWSTVVLPSTTALSVGFAVALLFGLFWPNLLFTWIAVLVTSSLLICLFSIVHKKSIILEQSQQLNYLDQQRQWLHVSTLWHFTRSVFSYKHIEQQAMLSATYRIQVDTVERFAEIFITLVSLMFTSTVFFHFVAIEHPAYWVIAFMVFLSIRDWLQPLMHAIFEHNRLTQTSVQLFGADRFTAKTVPLRVFDRIETVNSVEFKNFAWQRDARIGPSLSAQLPSVGLFRIEAPTGMGKSSLFDAMTGELSFQGTLKLNQQSYNPQATQSMPRLFHYLQQHEHVFTGTLAENLRFGCSQASDDDLLDALKWAELTQWAKPETLNTWLGPQGLPISGGEKKRLFLARAYLSNAPILLLDEPFEGLDDVTIRALVKKLNSLCDTKLVLLVSHLKPMDLVEIQCFKLAETD